MSLLIIPGARPAPSSTQKSGVTESTSCRPLMRIPQNRPEDRFDAPGTEGKKPRRSIQRKKCGVM